ncbi:hypothetical protein BGW42_004456 [Actinomortierella wolfii]|nr:hypothetical protein BGW42_004456 [Actinomortierella wolfii]
MSRRHPLRIVIVGAGLGGLLLAHQLERSQIDYVIVERNDTALMPLEGGGVLFVQKVAHELLADLGLLDRVLEASASVGQVYVKEFIHGQESSSRVLKNDTIAITRPELYNILVQGIPPTKLQLGKTAEQIEQDEHGIRCICAGGEVSFSGDILVGADGAYSAVRLHMLRELGKQGALSDNDRKRMQSDCIRLVGQATELDPSSLPQLPPGQSDCNVQVAIHKRDQLSYTHLQEPEDCPDLEDLTYHADLVEAMCGTFRTLPSAWGPSVPHDVLFKATLPNTIGRLGRETKVYDAWHLGRLVLMGDACHKVLPYWGHPFAQAALDSIELHKALYRIAHSEEISTKDMEDILEGYVKVRMAEAKKSIVSSRKLDE